MSSTIAFSDWACTRTRSVRGKGANLGLMTAAGLPVPPGFVIPTDVYVQFIERSGIGPELFGIVDTFNYENAEELEAQTRRIRELIEGRELSEPVAEAIVAAYADLGED